MATTPLGIVVEDWRYFVRQCNIEDVMAKSSIGMPKPPKAPTPKAPLPKAPKPSAPKPSAPKPIPGVKY